jgi:ADP-ribosyl-[dinitrogen reductase] hydrolase
MAVPRAMMGAFVGDAMGVVLEFSDGTISEARVREAMAYPGGGPHRVGRGQFSDDGELTLTLWRALRSGEARLRAMMLAYADWLNSDPFDIGNTCNNAFEVFHHWRNGAGPEEKCIPLVRTLNEESEANGALMRATAIASYLDRFDPGDIQMGLSLAEQDAILSHPSQVCVEVNRMYVYALLLLLGGTAPGGVVKLLDAYIAEHVQSDCIHAWYFQESLDISNMNCDYQVGHIRWAFGQAMYFLRHPDIGFEEALFSVLKKGGDTDTNACIVGGLVACYQEIPRHLCEPVLAFDPSEKGGGYRRWRPKAYSVGGVFCKD